MSFDFDNSLSAVRNIDKFYKHLETVDAAFAALLKRQLQSILPLSDVPTQKKATRQKFNEAVVKHLDQKAGRLNNPLLPNRRQNRRLPGYQQRRYALRDQVQSRCDQFHFAFNGLGKSLLFEALTYAITGAVPKLDRVVAVESAKD